jgi:hypothetical protein
MKQLDKRRLNEARASSEQKRTRESNKIYFDSHKRLRTKNQRLEVGDLILMHNTFISGSRAVATKLDDRWFGPYRIREVLLDSTYYRLEELDGVPLQGTVAGNRVQLFFTDGAPGHSRLAVMPLAEEEEEEEEDRESV